MYRKTENSKNDYFDCPEPKNVEYLTATGYFISALNKKALICE
jgi:hypothetical protein